MEPGPGAFRRLGRPIAGPLALAGCGRAGAGADGPTVPVVVSAPVSSEPWVARSIEGGARLAVEEINADGGFDLEGGKRKAELVVLDHASSPATALANAREAVRRKAAVLLTDGTGVAGVGDITDRAALPTFILFQGGRDLVDPQAPPERVPARSGGRDHDPPARGLPRRPRTRRWRCSATTPTTASRAARRCATRSRSTRCRSSPTT